MNATLRKIGYCSALLIASTARTRAQSTTLLVLSKSDHTVAIVEPSTLQGWRAFLRARIPTKSLPRTTANAPISRTTAGPTAR
jgi:hypothetical protein